MPDRAVLLYNPASGRGRAEPFAQRLAVALERIGWSTDPIRVGDSARMDDLRSHFEGAGAVIAIGGDGTVHHAASAIAASGAPLLIAPMGTENLLAKELGMRADVEQITSAVERRQLLRIDLPSVNGIPFVVMCSVGLDAAVVRDVSKRRSGSIRKSHYVMPVIRQCFKPTAPALRVTVDGETILDGERGLLVVANCRRYAVGINPCRDANLSDGLLDVSFLPFRTAIGAAGWALRCRAGRQGASPRFVSARGRVINVEHADTGQTPVQFDGEAAPASLSLPLRFVADETAINTLRP